MSAKRKKRDVLPFGPFEDKKTCEHVWEPHVYERGMEYCPYCKSERPAGLLPATSREGER